LCCCCLLVNFNKRNKKEIGFYKRSFSLRASNLPYIRKM
jgi:hypothetical protein